MTATSRTRIHNLDLLRALAIILVIYFHTVQMVFNYTIPDRALFNLGKYGVNVFFVLSGFLIAGIYFRKQDMSPIQFWLKRFLRIYPPYLIMLLISWLAVAYARNEKFDWGFLLMIQNFYPTIPYFLVSWSLCIEEHFYLLFTLFIFVLPKATNQLFLWIALCILPTFFRYFLSNPEFDGFGYYTTATYFQMDALAFGVLAAYLVYQKSWHIKTSATLISILVIVLIGLSYLLSSHSNLITFSFGTTVLNFIITSLLLQLYFAKPLWISKTNFVKWNARMAYSIYLVHPLCIHFCNLIYGKLNLKNMFLQYGFMIIAIYLASYLFHKLVEQPTIGLRDKLLDREHKPALV